MIWKSRASTSIIKTHGTKKQWSGLTVYEYQQSKEEIEAYLVENPNEKVWGGTAFTLNKVTTDPTWENTPRFRFFVPEKTEKITLPEPKSMPLSKTNYSLTKKEWIKKVEYVQNQIELHQIEKAVLSRSGTYNLNESITTRHILSQLNTKYPNCYIFALDLGNKKTFLGASPERLFKKQLNTLHTEALAGTRERGRTATEDKTLELSLKRSKKDKNEHKIVLEYILERCKDLCQNIETSSPTILKFANVQHLFVELEGHCKNTTSPFTILERLHPTPAVCGTPREKAEDIINTIENHDRGWYGGALGWISRHEAEFAVGIRSALLAQNTLTYYTGVGIVSDSDPDKEWQELNHKETVFKPNMVVSTK